MCSASRFPSDVHSLRDVVAAIDQLACDGIARAGAALDYGLFPDETITLLVELRIPTLRGVGWGSRPSCKKR